MNDNLTVGSINFEQNNNQGFIIPTFNSKPSMHMDEDNKEKWNMSKEELIKSKEDYLSYFNNISYEPSEDSLAQYEILIKLEEVKQLILSKKDKVYFADRHGTFEKLNQIRDIVHI